MLSIYYTSSCVPYLFLIWSHLCLNATYMYQLAFFFVVQILNTQETAMFLMSLSTVCIYRKDGDSIIITDLVNVVYSTHTCVHLAVMLFYFVEVSSQCFCMLTPYLSNATYYCLSCRFRRPRCGL